jgi:C4-dicarboxylate-binding protein DctP
MNAKKTKAFALVLCIAMLIGLCSCASSSSTPSTAPSTSAAATATPDTTVYEFSISHIAALTDPINQGWELLKTTLEEKSNGRIKVTIYGNKALSNSNNEDAEKVEQNIVQATSVRTSSLAALGNIPQYQIFDYPYMFDNEAEIYTVLDSEMAQEWSKQLAETCGVKAYGGYNLGWCQIANNVKEICTPADMVGLKIRTMSSDLQMGIINALGANATVVNYGELFTACQQGTVDGMMTSTGLYVSDRFYEVNKYMTVSKAIPLLHVPIINAAWYDSLPQDLQAIFDESMGIYLEGVRQFELDYEAQALKTLAENGMQIHELTDAELQEFKDKSASVYTDFAKVAGQDTIDAVKVMLGR